MSELKVGDLVSANTDFYRSSIHKFMIVLAQHGHGHTVLRYDGRKYFYWQSELDIA